MHYLIQTRSPPSCSHPYRQGRLQLCPATTLPGSPRKIRERVNVTAIKVFELSSAAMHPPRAACRNREMVIYLHFPEWPFFRAWIILTLQPEGSHARAVLLVLGITHRRQTSQVPVHPSSQQAGTVPCFRRNLVVRLLCICRNERAAACCILGDCPFLVLVRDII